MLSRCKCNNEIALLLTHQEPESADELPAGFADPSDEDVPPRYTASAESEELCTPPRCKSHSAPSSAYWCDPSNLLLSEQETLVLSMASGRSFVLDADARRVAGVTNTLSLRRFIAFELKVMPQQIILLDGSHSLTNDDAVYTTDLSIVVMASDSETDESEQYFAVPPIRLLFNDAFGVLFTGPI